MFNDDQMRRWTEFEQALANAEVNAKGREVSVQAQEQQEQKQKQKQINHFGASLSSFAIISHRRFPSHS